MLLKISAFGLALSAASLASAATLGTRTISNAHHYGYFGFPSTSAQNFKALVGPFSGVCRTIQVQGTITKVHEEAWASSIRVLPSGAALATFQPWFQFTNQREFGATLQVSATIYAPGGFDLSRSMFWEMYSVDAEQFVPGIDARTTLTYTFDDSFAPGTAEYNGALTASDPTFNRPIQFETNPFGYTAPVLSNRTPHYDVQSFHVSAAGEYTIASASEFESAGVLYQNSFNPNNSLNNVLRALGQGPNVIRNNSFAALPFDDDATGGTLVKFNLVPGVQYYYLTTAFALPGTEPDGGPFIGKYTNIITGAGNVTLGLVPEPSAALSLLGLGLLRRRSR
jgi:hypothetical protein